MEEYRDYTIRNGIGIRVWGTKACRVIRLIKGKWVEIGSMYDLPVDDTALIWTQTGIPATILAVALRVYELDNPGTPLRSILRAQKLLQAQKPSREPVSRLRQQRKTPSWRREWEPVTGD